MRIPRVKEILRVNWPISITPKTPMSLWVSSSAKSAEALPSPSLSSYHLASISRMWPPLQGAAGKGAHREMWSLDSTEGRKGQGEDAAETSRRTNRKTQRVREIPPWPLLGPWHTRLGSGFHVILCSYSLWRYNWLHVSMHVISLATVYSSSSVSPAPLS